MLAVQMDLILTMSCPSGCIGKSILLDLIAYQVIAAFDILGLIPLDNRPSSESWANTLLVHIARSPTGITNHLKEKRSRKPDSRLC